MESGSIMDYERMKVSEIKLYDSLNMLNLLIHEAIDAMDGSAFDLVEIKLAKIREQEAIATQACRDFQAAFVST